MSKSITAHTLVQNEERYLWFSVMSVIDFVDKVFIWDTGSSDKTLRIIKEIEKVRPGKVYFKEIGSVTPDIYSSVRQRMLDETKSDWFILVDGDEVWWEDKIHEVISIINERGDSLNSIVSSYKNIVGDIYHYQENQAGQYNIDSRKGHINIRAINRKIPDLHFEKPHGQLALVDGRGVSIQNMDFRRRLYTEGSSYLHFTNIARSSNKDILVPKRGQKLKYEIGKSFPLDFYYPEVFFRSLPTVVSSPWGRMNGGFLARAFFETPLRMLRRRLINIKSGY